MCGSVGKALTLQAEGPELEPQSPHENSRCGAGERAQHLRALASPSEDLGIYMMVHNGLEFRF